MLSSNMWRVSELPEVFIKGFWWIMWPKWSFFLFCINSLIMTQALALSSCCWKKHHHNHVFSFISFLRHFSRGSDRWERISSVWHRNKSRYIVWCCQAKFTYTKDQRWEKEKIIKQNNNNNKALYSVFHVLKHCSSFFSAAFRSCFPTLKRF